jgi:tetratricopeptide (TPR) repeat protein
MPSVRRRPRLLAWPLRALTVLLCTAVVPSRAVASAERHWIRIDASHFSVLTDADEKHGHEVAVRFEQMRAAFAQLLMKSRVNMPVPIEILAFRDDDEYERAAPVRQGTGLNRGFFVPGEDRTYFVLNLSHEDSWAAVSSDFARVLLQENYPPTQAWFDQGFVEYFSTLHLSDNEMRIGGDPSPSLVSVLNRANWLGLTQLFVANPHGLDESQRTLFRAESWIVLAYLLHKEQLPAVGTYFGLVENEKLAVEDAVEKAFGVSPAGLEQAVRDYFRSLTPAEGKASNAATVPGTPMSASVTADTVGSSAYPVPEPEARALVAEMKLRMPDHRAEARRELDSILDQATVGNVVAHRALAWDLLEQKQYAEAVEELAKAVALDSKDPWTHYYLAIAKFQDAQSNGGELKGLANMMQDLHVVLDWDHEMAEAYHLLALAQIEGGGLRAASDSIHAAIALAPRKPGYQLDLAKIYEAGKNWDAATALLERLSGNSDPEVANAANKALHDLPYVEKYGIPPLSATGSPPGATAPASPEGRSPAASPKQNRSSEPTVAGSGSSQAGDNGDERNEEAAPKAEPAVDHRPIQYRKGKLLTVDCSPAPAAIVTVVIGAKTVRLRAADYKSLTLIGADTFSCDWVNRAVSVNYRPGGHADGDLVSLEVY